jgi:hypothetical protein
MNTQIEFPAFSEMAVSEIFQYEKFAVFLRSDNIIQVQVKDSIDINFSDVKDILNCIQLLSGEKTYPLIALYGTFNTFEKDAMTLVSQHNLTRADALITEDNWAITLIAKFYLKMFPPVRPTQIFKETQTALRWLQTFNIESELL